MATTTRRALLTIGAAAATVAVLPRASAAAPGAPTRPAFRYADANSCGQGSAFVVANRSGSNILEVYVRQSGSTGWGEDRLGDKIIGPAGAHEFDPGQGIWDVLIVRADGRPFLAMRQNACRISRVEISANDTIAIS